HALIYQRHTLHKKQIPVKRKMMDIPFIFCIISPVLTFCEVINLRKWSSKEVREMSGDRYELLSVEQMRQKYGLVVENRQHIQLDPEKVPEGLRHLIPYAELWGVGDDIIRDDMVKRASPEIVEDLRRVIEIHEDLLDKWLAGPEAESSQPSVEYLAFSAMRMAADFT
ncbi:MAG: hypothetical protein KA419_09990, partial [Acidobacteria bacterium]|nr:hypothetical protein [Acidobacteriota bacterium]